MVVKNASSSPVKTSAAWGSQPARPAQSAGELGQLRQLAAATVKAKKMDQLPDAQKVIELTRTVVSNPRTSRGDRSEALRVLAGLLEKSNKLEGWGPKGSGISASIEKGAEAVVGKLTKFSSLDDLSLAEDKAFEYLGKSGAKLSNEGLCAIATAYQSAYEVMAGQ